MCFKRFYEKNLKPDYLIADLRTFDWPSLLLKNIEIIFLDIDNTLALHGSYEPDQFAKEIIKKIRAAGFKICVLSNARSSRSKIYATNLQVDYMSNACKPSPKRLLQKLAEENITSDAALLVGDQLFTDIWAGKNAKCHTMLVKQRYDREAVQIKLKRLLEKIFLNKYEKRDFL